MKHISFGCFGKLPNFSDYIRINLNSKEFKDLDEWIQRGLDLGRERYQKSLELIHKKAPGYIILYSYKKYEKFLLGILLPSNDSSGRIYPFMILAEINKSYINEFKTHFIPSVFFKLLIQMNQFLENVTNVNNTAQIEKLLIDLVPPSLDDIQDCNSKYELFLSYQLNKVF